MRDERSSGRVVIELRRIERRRPAKFGRSRTDLRLIRSDEAVPMRNGRRARGCASRPRSAGLALRVLPWHVGRIPSTVPITGEGPEPPSAA
jgi:hypothetical protein